MGVHWHDPAKFRNDNFKMNEALGNYSALNPDALVFFLEALPQHFDAPDGSGSFDNYMAATNRSKKTCEPVNLTRIESDLLLGNHSTSTGTHNFNRMAKLATEQTQGVHWLPTAFEAFATRDDAHNGRLRRRKPYKDCTHSCYAPNLWEPTVAPFFLVMDMWYRGILQ